MKNMEKREPALGAPLPGGGGDWKRGSKGPPAPQINFSGALDPLCFVGGRKFWSVKGTVRGGRGVDQGNRSAAVAFCAL